MLRQNGLVSVLPQPLELPRANHGVLIGMTAPNLRHYEVAPLKSSAKEFISSVKMMIHLQLKQVDLQVNRKQ
jgi:hypothetical protein